MSWDRVHPLEVGTDKVPIFAFSNYSPCWSSYRKLFGHEPLILLEPKILFKWTGVCYTGGNVVGPIRTGAGRAKTSSSFRTNEPTPAAIRLLLSFHVLAAYGRRRSSYLPLTAN